MSIFGEKIYLPAITGASGVTKEQAKTCLYYVMATYLLPDKLARIPILAIIGPQGTGKSSLLLQLSEMVNEPKLVAAESIPTLRDKLSGCITALIDEGDEVYEDYLIKRYAKNTAKISHKRSAKGGWPTVNKDIFGATIIVRRTPFKNSATTSRSITIRTRYKDASYHHKSFYRVGVNSTQIVGKLDLSKLSETTNRIMDNWVALQKIAEYLGDKEWLEYSSQEIGKGLKTLRGSQNYEPDLALLLVLKERMITLTHDDKVVISGDVLMSTIRDDLKTQFDLHLKNVQIQEMCRAFGFRVASHAGYPRVKSNQGLLEKLLKERQL